MSQTADVLPQNVEIFRFANHAKRVLFPKHEIFLYSWPESVAVLF